MGISNVGVILIVRSLLITILLLLSSKSFVYSSSNGKSNDGDYVVIGPTEYPNWEFVTYDKDLNFYYVAPSSIMEREDGLLFKEDIVSIEF